LAFENPNTGIRCNQCSQGSSRSVPGVRRDGLRLIARLFRGARRDYAREGEYRTDCRGLQSSLGLPALDQVEIIHLRPNYYRIMRCHSCSPPPPPTVQGAWQSPRGALPDWEHCLNFPHKTRDIRAYSYFPIHKSILPIVPELGYRVIVHEPALPCLREGSLLTPHNTHKSSSDINTCPNLNPNKEGSKVTCLASTFMFPYTNQPNNLFPLETRPNLSTL